MTAGMSVEVVLPSGFHPYPLSDIDGQIDLALRVLAPLAPRESLDSLVAVVRTLRGSLAEMRRSGVLYCGMGRHLSAVDGTEVTAWLTVWVREVGPARNPRLAVRDFVMALAGEPGGPVAVHDVEGRPMAIHENPVLDSPGEDRSVYQLRVCVPSENGAWIAVLEVSTSSAGHGPEYLGLLVEAARTVRFVEERSPALCL